MLRLLVIASVGACLLACGAATDSERLAVSNTGLRYLGDEAAPEFERAISPRELSFPADHGEHRTFRTEWWYFTGNLETPAGRDFGFELTFFRFALKPGDSPLETGSAWRTDQVWMAHLAVTDVVAGRFTAVERLARASLGVAGATAQPLQVWVRDWSARGSGSASGIELELDAQDEEIGLRLQLNAAGPPVSHGERGLDRKGGREGNASYYYSVPRLATRGTIRVGEQEFDVSGLAWLDREWSTSALEPGVVGWDWFALQLTDGRSLMYYRLRERDGGTSRFSGGSLIESDGTRSALGATDVELAPERLWTSPSTGVRYPVAWQLRVPSAGLILDIAPYLDHQELDLSVRYWEGAVFVEGMGPEGAILGRGYLELAGYE
jgi:predicted secreted hydrolase